MRILLIALALSFMGILFELPGHAATATPAQQPDIVVFLIDDVSRDPRSLFSDPARTPEVAAFARQGVEFRNAISPTPLSGPSRVSLLTGRHGHVNGMTRQTFEDAREVGLLPRAMRRAGYQTAFVGKYVNGFYKRHRTSSSVEPVARAWNHFDIVWDTVASDRYGWLGWTKEGTHRYGDAYEDHTSHVAADQAARRIRNTDPDKPLFMVVSLIDGHVPHIPLHRFEEHPSCAGIDPWDSPALDEKNVSDKPAYVQARKRAPWRDERRRADMVARCEATLTTDWVIGQVNDALRDSGRYERTFQVLLGDNGILYGEHRLRYKEHAYATPIPMYVRWPGGIGNQRRVVREPVAVVDLPRTFCALGGCTLADQDGKSLVPLIRGKRTRLDRDYIFTEMLHAADTDRRTCQGRRPAWSGVDTTLRYDETLWSYVRYQTGEEELYDLNRDRYRLRNLADARAYRPVLRDVRAMWQRTWQRDDVRWGPQLQLPELN